MMKYPASKRLQPNQAESGGSTATALPESSAHLWTRRRFFAVAAGGGMVAFLLTGFVGMIRFMYPRVLFEPPSKFKVGYPHDYTVGAVSTRWKKTHKVWIVRESTGFYAVLARCTHLGCTPGWFGTEEKFKCFCHGSGFRKSGVNYEGPAPRALERVKISLADDGQLLIDKSKIFRYEKGEWQEPGAFLEI